MSESSILEMLAIISEGRHLTEEQAMKTMEFLMRGEATPSQCGAFLMGLRINIETAEELSGFARAMRRLATPVVTTRRPLVDTCGTGGDGAGTFNISTTAAFIVAGAGIAVAKHGNRGASSRCGSADVLEALGVNLDVTPEIAGRSIDTLGIGFLYARSLHGAMRHVAPVRQELRIRTVFNLLGPLANPAGACGQVLGTPSPELARKLAEVCLLLGVRRALVASSEDGLDEISLSAPTRLWEVRGGALRSEIITPDMLGLPHAERETLAGGDPAHNAAILRAILEGETGPRRDVAVANAAAGILAGDGAEDWLSAVHTARRSIDSGEALGKLENLIRFTNDPR